MGRSRPARAWIMAPTPSRYRSGGRGVALAAVPGGWALLQERSHTLPGVLGAEGDGLGLALPADRLGEARLERGVQLLLDEALRQWRPLKERLRHLHCPIHQPVRLDRLEGEPDLHGLGGLDDAPRERQLLGALQADDPGQQPRPTEVEGEAPS